MKQRNGFVSNSSSSSFILITTQENWDRAKAVMHPYAAAVAEALQGKPFEGLGQKLVKFTTWDNHGGSWGEYVDVAYEGPRFNVDPDADPDDDYDDYEEDDKYEAFDAACEELQKGDCITHNQDVG